MTISKADMQKNLQLAVQILSEYCLNVAIGEEFEKDQSEFGPILPTTWKALSDDFIIRQSLWHFQLTPSGWIDCLKAAGKLCDDQMKKDLGLVSRKLKDRLERTEGPAYVGTHEIVAETGFEEYWIMNVIDSHLIRVCLNQKDAYWADGDQMKSVIEVPIDFGHKL